MQRDLPLLILADIPKDFSLTDLALSEQATKTIELAPSQYQNLDKLRATVSGMTFDLICYSAPETETILATKDLQQVFCEPPVEQISGIGISLSEHITVGRQDGTVNRALLHLAKHIGQAIKASSIIWQPAQLHIGFDYFAGAIEHYISDGPFPVLVQIAISETPEGEMETCGLSYFADQEIRLRAPDNYAANEVAKRLVRIAHDMATNGRIEEKSVQDGFIPGEKLSIMPGEDGQWVEIAIISKPLHDL
ncbi:hypothetical protein AB1K62_03190 [Parasphingorhabdus sp. JC815]|uniref:hypothetical protein n=1 Tax=Parasphingorhabdus sp. JC815 TaxID=3232140 RepID=UPI0034587C6C